jgi:hypothetical protein
MITLDNKLKVKNFSLHKIDSDLNLPFNEKHYSRFKHGSKRYAKEFGESLANGFIESNEFAQYVKHYSDKIVVVLASPYCFIPTATHAIKDYFLSIINTELVKLKCRPAQECKIFRDYSYVADYSAMNANERKKSISADFFHVDKEFLNDKWCIFLDDIKITGSHENCVENLIIKNDLHHTTASIMYMYFAELTNKEINPNLEAFLNHADVSSFADICDIIHEDGFIFNTRNIKFILSSPSDYFQFTIECMKKSFRRTLYCLAIRNGYHDLVEFNKNIKILKRTL